MTTQNNVRDVENRYVDLVVLVMSFPFVFLNKSKNKFVGFGTKGI